MMMSQSLYRTLKAEYPSAEIDVMAPVRCRLLLARMPEVNQALAMPLGHGALGLGERAARPARQPLRSRTFYPTRSNPRWCLSLPISAAHRLAGAKCVTAC